MKKIKPTLGWIAAEYSKLNEKLFDGKLGPCKFELSDIGSKKLTDKSDVLGFFGSAKDIFVDESTRKLYVVKISNGKETKCWLNARNFQKLFKPVIHINSNYSAPESSWRAILVHEMCHYKTIFPGIWPIRHHGKDFHEMAERIYKKSRGRIKVEDTIKARTLGFELDYKIRKTRKKFADKKKSKLKAVFLVRDWGKTELTMTSSDKLVKAIFDLHSVFREKANGDFRGLCSELVVSTDPKIIEKLYSRGYCTDFKVYKYWTLPDDLKNIFRRKSSIFLLEKPDKNKAG